MPTEVANELISPFTDVPNAPLDEKGNVRYGSEFFRNVAELQVGYGGQVLRVDRQGLWLGAENFADAPFSVDMSGNIVATSLTLGTIGGTLDDIANGSTYAKTTFNEVLGASYAKDGLNSSGEIIKGFLNSQLSSKSLPSSGVRVDSNGIYGRDSGTTTFYISSTGDAYFSGDIASASMSASTITGSTITGTTLSTATSGQRVVLFSTLASYYNSSGTLIASTYAASSAFLIKGETSSSSIYLDAGSTGVIAFIFNGTTRFIADYANRYFAPVTGDTIDLGNIVGQWRDFWHTGEEVYQGMTQPVIYFGSITSGGTIVDDNNVPWSVSQPSTGIYEITHSFGHDDYAVHVTPIASTVKNASCSSVGTSSFRVRIANLSDTLEDNDFFFTVFEYPQ